MKREDTVSPALRRDAPRWRARKDCAAPKLIMKSVRYGRTGSLDARIEGSPDQEILRSRNGQSITRVA